MTDAPFALFDFLGIKIATIIHIQLRKIKDISCWIMRADAGKRPVTRTFEYLDFGIFFFHAGINQLDILHLETEVIEAGLTPRRPRVKVQAHVAVADYDCAARALQARSPHVKNIVIKIAFSICVASDNRHMPHLCKHEHLRGRRDETKLVEPRLDCQPNRNTVGGGPVWSSSRGGHVSPPLRSHDYTLTTTTPLGSR